MLANRDNIPVELKQFNQWVCWRIEPVDKGKPRKVPLDPATGKYASVTDPSTWGTFDEAIARNTQSVGIGFVLTDADPYVLIDLDRDERTTEDEMRTQQAIYNYVDSYAEMSPSWKGVHIISKGSLPSAVKRNFIEMYGTARYFTVTGQVQKALPINECQPQILNLWEKYTTAFERQITTPDHAEKMPDTQIWELARSAENGEKFNDLWYGNWQKYYQSQSEADFALINIISFYSKNVQQIERLFLQSALGQRDKAKNRPNYVVSMIKKSFDTELPLIDFSQLQANFSKINETRATIPEKYTRLYANEDEIARENVYGCPPGLLGKIAEFIFKSSVRPVPEISLAAAISCMAGICGRQYNISNTGLNQYIMLLAPTGTGKEGMATGVERLFNSIRFELPTAQRFLGPGELASGQALIKYIATDSNCFLSIIGEFGIRLQALSNPKALGSELMLKKVLLDLFIKSGYGQVLRPTIYSEREKNIPSVNSPAFSLLGESTPERFYSAIDESMIAEGLLPRFTIIEYTGNRTPFNANHDKIAPSQELKQEFMTLCNNVMQLEQNNLVINVRIEKFAQDRLDMLNLECDNKINNSKSDIYRQLWSRAHLKTMKLAAIVAVGINNFEPTITIQCVEWAEKIVKLDVTTLIHKFETGVAGSRGNQESEQLETVVNDLKRYTRIQYGTLAKYGVTEAMHKNYLVPYTYFQRRFGNMKIFREDRNGSTAAIKRTIATLIEIGDLQQMNDKQANLEWNSRARLYMIVGQAYFNQPSLT